MDLVSVIIPAYNVEDYIVNCLNSIVNQSYKKLEIIVINDGSTDDTLKKIKSVKDKRIVLINQKNTGQSIARNKGIEKAKGKYIMFVDADDFISNDLISKMIKIAKKDNSEIVYCDYYKYYNASKLSYEFLVPLELQKYKNSAILSMPGPTCKLILRKLIDRIDFSFPDNIIFEDNAVIPYLIANSKKTSYLNEASYYYLQRVGSSLNQNKYSKKFEDIFESLNILYNYFESSKILKKYHDELEYIFIEYLIHAAGLKFLKYPQGINNLNKIKEIIDSKFPKWRRNKYFKKMSLKYKIVCNLIYKRRTNLLKLLLRSK